MRRDKVEDVLLKIGVPAVVKGFIYIADAMEFFEEMGADITFTKELYPAIAKKRKVTALNVERCIRHAFDVARSGKGDYETADHYIGFVHCSSGNSLRQLYMKLKREEE